MEKTRHTAGVILAALLALPAASPPNSVPAGAVRVDFSKETAGAEPKAFLPVVGNWLIAQEDGNKVVLVDGRQWRKGQPAGGLAENARAIYGSRHEEFLDNVKAFAYYPYAVASAVENFTDGEISMRFRLLEGLLDQCAGILFNLKQNGDYWTVRFNDKEDNLVLWTFNKGKRSFVKKNVHDVPLPMQEWHSITVKVKGTALEAYLDDEKLIEYTLANPVSGKVGVWSKTDSVSAFDDFEVTPAK